MKKQILPNEILDSSYELHQFKFNKRSKQLYVIVLVLIITILVSLPFIEIDMYTSVKGIIKTQQERIPLRITQSGQVLFSNLKPHRYVVKGDTLLKINHPVLSEQKELLRLNLMDQEVLVKDLKLYADEILVLDKGKVIETGTHQELLSIKGYYCALWKQQVLV